ncbi:MAG: archease [Candidatus Eisenbacteria bacterium]|nr:archease [Candidatus Eisenbacteria bacterium]
MSRRPKYTELEHTADVGMELTAGSLTEAFEQAAAAMFDLICDLDRVGRGVRRVVRVEARENDLENMMVRWLTELLFLFDSERLVLSRFAVRSLTSDAIEAHVDGEVFDPSRHSVKADIKAVTYHELTVEPRGPDWYVRVIFDM